MFLKRLFDVFVSLFGIIILLPFFILIAILIRIKMGKGPILFLQKRVGRYGNLFTMIKFRIMTVDHKGGSISVKGEKRITPFGSILRKYKLDELPELLNIFKGEMSFVGPRPDVPGYADKLVGENRKILELRPGITGPASLKYSSEEELLALQPNPIEYNNTVIWPDKVNINLDYYYKRNFWLDMKIIIYTLFKKELSI